MTDYDERANDRADEHAQMMSKQRVDVIRATYDVPRNHYEIKDDTNEIND